MNNYYQEREKIFIETMGYINNLAYRWREENCFVNQDAIWDLDDIKQEMYVAFLKAYDDYYEKEEEDHTAAFRTYWQTCLQNRFTNIGMKSARRIEVDTGEHASHTSYDDWLEKREEQGECHSYNECSDDIHNIVNKCLSERDSEIVRMYFGIGVGSPSTQEDLSRAFDIPRRTVSGIITRALNKPELVSQLKEWKGN